MQQKLLASAPANAILHLSKGTSSINTAGRMKLAIADTGPHTRRLQVSINTRAVTAIGRPSATRRPAMLDGLRAAYARWQERTRIRYELQQMTTRELADLGLSPWDIDDVASGAYRRGE